MALAVAGALILEHSVRPGIATVHPIARLLPARRLAGAVFAWRAVARLGTDADGHAVHPVADGALILAGHLMDSAFPARLDDRARPFEGRPEVERLPKSAG